MSKHKVKKVSSGAKWEDIVGYSRAIKHGSHVEISGTIAMGDNRKLVGINNPSSQTRQIIEIAKDVLESLGGSLNDVTRTRIYVTDISRWEEVGLVHGEYFEKIKPVTTMVEVSKLILPEALVEIEFSAIIG